MGASIGGAVVGALSDFWGFFTTSDNWWGSSGIISRTSAHVRISVAAMLVATVIALPPAFVLGHVRRGGLAAVSIVNVGRAIPSLGILAFCTTINFFGFGYRPTLVALVALAIPPVFTNTYTGVRGVDQSVVEAARGMGMTPREVLLRVEVPTAIPLIITGLRISAVQVVATATLGALVAFECLGSFINEGIAQFDNGKLITGAVLVAVLALVTDGFFVVVQRVSAPWLRGRGRRPRTPLVPEAGPAIPRIQPIGP
ncbi:MAG: osmoprotectant transport system permease protein [Actinomycetota bacterium]|nr:osmoprotectant transport system permease protein [Actinomycetota bacterium]